MTGRGGAASDGPGGPGGGGVPDDEELRRARAEAVVRHEWTQFQAVRGDDGRADCQNDWPQFRQMRLSQFLTWPLRLLLSYAADLQAADAVGRNLLTEKYARMMASTEPERYARQIAPVLPVLSDERLARQEAVVAVQVAWARDFRARYPHLGEAMRVLRTAEDTLAATSFETYLRGELGTYSDRTFAHYRRLVEATTAAGRNLTELTVAWTVELGGRAGLDEAEAAQAG